MTHEVGQQRRGGRALSKKVSYSAFANNAIKGTDCILALVIVYNVILLELRSFGATQNQVMSISQRQGTSEKPTSFGVM